MHKTYDLNKVILLLNGVRIRGFADGDVITVKAKADLWSLDVGADGEAVRSRINDRSADVEIKLGYGSASTAVLDAARKIDEQLGTNSVAFMLRDTASGTQVICADVWQKRIPDVVFGQKPGARTFMLEGSDFNVDHNGLIGSGGA